MQTCTTRLIVFALTLALPASLAHAVLVTDVTQTIDGVVVTGSGTLNVTDLTLAGFSSTNGFPSLRPADGAFTVDVPPTNTATDIYLGSFSAPGAFGSGGTQFGTSGTGDVFGVSGFLGTQLVVPDGYASGTPLSGSSTFAGETISSLGLTPGSYTWSWGSGVNADSLVLNIAAVPEPSLFVAWLAVSVGVASRRKSR